MVYVKYQAFNITTRNIVLHWLVIIVDSIHDSYAFSIKFKGHLLKFVTIKIPLYGVSVIVGTHPTIVKLI